MFIYLPHRKTKTQFEKDTHHETSRRSSPDRHRPLRRHAVVSISADQAELASAYVQEAKFGHFKKKAFKKGFYGGFAGKKFVGKKKFKSKVFFY